MVVSDILKQQEIFASAPENILDEIQARAQIGPYAPGEVIVPAEQPFTFFGVILEGEVNVYLAEQQGPPQSIETIGVGGIIGAMSLLTGQDSPVDVIATTPCRVLLISPDLFHRWVQADSTALQEFSKLIARRSILIEQQQQANDRQLQERDAEKDPYGLNLTPEDPQKLLVLNLRTGSLKYRYFDTDDESKHVEGQVEWIGEPRATQTHITAAGERTFELGMID
ncbi:MAG: cyclic nucleotide-binding domain-containing protein, partial [Anaerolineae bacterium]